MHITLGEMVRHLNREPRGLASWEADMVQRAHKDSHFGLRPNMLSLRQAQFISTIFYRIYHA